MPKRTEREFLVDIREAITRIHAYSKNLNFESFLRDLKTQDAIVHNIEILGEAVKNFSDDFLKEEGLLAEVEANAIKRVISYQIAELMKKHNLSKAAMAKRMKTSLSSIDRLLDPQNESVTLQTLERAALVLGKSLQISFI